MAVTMSKRGQQDNVITNEFICDTTADLQNINPRDINLGSVAIVLQGLNGLEVYMANSQQKWINLGAFESESNNNENENSTVGPTSPIADQGTADNMVLQE